MKVLYCGVCGGDDHVDDACYGSDRIIYFRHVRGEGITDVWDRFQGLESKYHHHGLALGDMMWCFFNGLNSGL